LPAEYAIPDPSAQRRRRRPGLGHRIQARELVRARQRIAGVIARETGRSLASVLADIDRDRWMSAEEARETFLVPLTDPVKPYAQAVQSAVRAKDAGATPYLIRAPGN
jgi:Clp protease